MEPSWLWRCGMLDFSGVVTPKKASPLHVADIVRDAFFMGVLHCSGAWTCSNRCVCVPRPPFGSCSNCEVQQAYIPTLLQ